MERAKNRNGQKHKCFKLKKIAVFKFIEKH